MRHRVAHRKLGMVTEHRLSLLRSLATDLLRHERIRTTVPRAKELRPFVERLITTAKKSVADGATPVDGVNARRAVSRDIHDHEVLKKLFRDLAPRYVSRPGGYVRILRIGYRRGDSAELAQVELVGSEYNPKAAAEKKARGEKARPTGMGGRLRAAAARRTGARKTEQASTADTEKAD